MAVSFRVKFDQQAWVKAIREKERPVATAAVAALRDVAADAVQEGRDNIAGSGRFTGKWVSGLQYRTSGATAGGLPSLNAKATIFHSIGLGEVFEFGATIEGKPLLWIPTHPGDPPARQSRKHLVSATVRGTPMLFDANDPDRQRQPLYVGVPAVHIAKRWDIIAIIEKHANQIGEAFIKEFKDN